MDADTNICAVILNYNDAQTTMKLTESWKDSKVIRNIIIVDNCSTDDSWERLGEFKEEFASDHTDNSDNLDKVQLHLFRTAKNGGYGSGNQAGIDYAVQYLEPDYIMIANPDVQVSDACILPKGSRFIVNAPTAAKSRRLKNRPRYKRAMLLSPNILARVNPSACGI